MSQGWIRAYREEVEELGFFDRGWQGRNERAELRAGFRTPLHEQADESSEVLEELEWGATVELPAGLSGEAMTEVSTQGGTAGFVRSNHVVELAWVKRRGSTVKKMRATLSYESHGKTEKRELIWGDCVQIIERGETTSTVRARGWQGTMKNSDLSGEALLEVYFIDVGQGDGVLVRTPDGRHLLVDGGLERKKQHTGKNAADFVDWKFFREYGDFRVRLDSMMASHSDSDHYGGLHDLVRKTTPADRELDCLGTDVATLHHPGLSRWEKRSDTEPPHADGLGPRSATGYFVRLLGDRDDAEAAIENGATDELSTYWNWFFRDALGTSESMEVERVGVDRDLLAVGGALPELWPARSGCSIRVLGPVTVAGENGAPTLIDLGKKSINTNGHSICLRVDYGKARILLTGDLNKDSMDWLRQCYGDCIGAFECDVAKACHHGSHDISYRFLEAMRPAATVISSGDAEGHGHPRPEIVGASAISGYTSVDRDEDVLLTPLIYMTEIERSVSLGAVNRIDFKGLPLDDESVAEGILPGRYLDELSSAKRFSPTENEAIEEEPAEEQAEAKDHLKERLKALEQLAIGGEAVSDYRATYYYSVPRGVVYSEHREKPVWKSRIMEKNHYGLVNVRTDGELVMCATMDETEEDWILHAFPARFGD